MGAERDIQETAGVIASDGQTAVGRTGDDDLAVRLHDCRSGYVDAVPVCVHGGKAIVAEFSVGASAGTEPPNPDISSVGVAVRACCHDLPVGLYQHGY